MSACEPGTMGFRPRWGNLGWRAKAHHGALALILTALPAVAEPDTTTRLTGTERDFDERCLGLFSLVQRQGQVAVDGWSHFARRGAMRYAEPFRPTDHFDPSDGYATAYRDGLIAGTLSVADAMLDAELCLAEATP